MIVGTTKHPKFLELVAELDIAPCYVAGILECLWNFTREFCPHGNIGRFSNRAIARGIGYEGDHEKLIDSLLTARWLDASSEHRLLVHDWPDHCGASVHGRLARSRQLFANGAVPDEQSLHSTERPAFREWISTLKTEELGKEQEFLPKNTGVPSECPRSPQPLTLNPLKNTTINAREDDPPEMVRKVIGTLCHVWPPNHRGDPRYAQMAGERAAAAHAGGVAAWCQLIARDGPIHAEAHKSCRESNPRHFIPTIERWISSGDYACKPPEPEKPQQPKQQPKKLTNLEIAIQQRKEREAKNANTSR